MVWMLNQHAGNVRAINNGELIGYQQLDGPGASRAGRNY
jgi:hypothetical protein